MQPLVKSPASCALRRFRMLSVLLLAFGPLFITYGDDTSAVSPPGSPAPVAATASPADSGPRDSLVDYDSLNRGALAKAATVSVTSDSLSRVDSVVKEQLQKALSSVKEDDTFKAVRLKGRIDSLSAVDSVRQLKKTETIDRLRANMKGFPVMLARDTVFLVFMRYGPFTASERAAAISKRLVKLAKNISFKPDSLVVVAGEASMDFVYGETVLMSVTDRDALWYHKSMAELAGEYRTKLLEAIKKYRKENALLTIILRIVEVIAILGVAFGVVLLVRYLFRRLRILVRYYRRKYITGLRIKTVSLLTKEQQYLAVTRTIWGLEILVYLLVAYITLPILFSVFPWTRSYSGVLMGWIFSPLKRVAFALVNYLPNVFNIAVIVVVTRGILNVLKKVFREIEGGRLVVRGFYSDWAKPTFNIVRFVSYALMFVMIFPYLPGPSSPVFKGVSVFLGILFSLGSTSAISNIVAGLVITYMRPFSIGDRIRIGEITGDVVEKNLLVTRLRTIKNEEITLPNAQVLSGSTLNYSNSARNLGLIIHTSVTIGYDAPWRTVHRLLIEAANKTEGIDRTPEPFVIQKSLDDFFVTYEINAYTRLPKNTVGIYSDLHQNIQDGFRDENVEIMSPHYRSVRNGNAVTVPVKLADDMADVDQPESSKKGI